jgi:Xaa-Pro aminopeptidase
LKQTKERRKKLHEILEDGDLAIIFATSALVYPHYLRQESNFLYFTKLEIPDAVYIQKKIKDKQQTALFIERPIPELEVWDGKKLSKEEALAKTGVDSVFYLDELNRKMSYYLAGTSRCYLNLNNANLELPLNKQQLFAQKLRERYPALIIEDIIKPISKLRAVKDKWEIQQIQKAIDVTGKAIEEMMKNARSGMMEYELEAYLLYTIRAAGLPHLGFHPIIGSGINAATLHYNQNNSKIGRNDLILMDVGAACNGYSADITRTFPVSGKFNNRQKEVYQAVLDINKEIISLLKPGVSLLELNNRSVELITDALFKLELIKKKEEYFKFYMHSIGHHLGMDTHDIIDRQELLMEGNVITVEPGIYIPKEKIGVRIEDDILITNKGFKNLSAAIPKEIEELESAVNK